MYLKRLLKKYSSSMKQGNSSVAFVKLEKRY